MSIFTFSIVSDELTHLKGMRIDVETMNYPGFALDPPRLKEWCVGIADDVVTRNLTEEDLISDSIRIRITTANGKIVVDTIKRSE